MKIDKLVTQREVCPNKPTVKQHLEMHVLQPIFIYVK